MIYPARRLIPRYMRASDGSFVRMWGRPLICKGRKP